MFHALWFLDFLRMIKNFKEEGLGFFETQLTFLKQNLGKFEKGLDFFEKVGAEFQQGLTFFHRKMGQNKGELPVCRQFPIFVVQRYNILLRNANAF